MPLARAGWRVTGIDFGPAAIARTPAQQARPRASPRVTFLEADLTALPADLAADLAPVDVATFWFGEFNSFPSTQARAMLAEWPAAVMATGGLLVLEFQPWDLFARDDSTSWEAHDRSVFCDQPHLWLQEHVWDEDAARRDHRPLDPRGQLRAATATPSATRPTPTPSWWPCWPTPASTHRASSRRSRVSTSASSFPWWWPGEARPVI